MTAYYAAYGLFALAAVALACLARPSAKSFAGVVVLIMGLWLMATPWGRPKPMWAELACDVSGETTVLAGQPREDEGRILLWLQADDCEPTAYAMPYSHERAEQLARALEEAQRQGTDARLRFEPSLERREPKFYAPPPQVLPPKPEPPAPMLVPEEAA